MSARSIEHYCTLPIFVLKTAEKQLIIYDEVVFLSSPPILKTMKQILFLLFLLISCGLTHRGYAQRNKVYSDNIKTLKVVAGDNWLAMPVIRLNDNIPIHISFDDLTHEYQRYAYKIEHCDADWKVSEGLFASDYIEGFEHGNLLEDFTQSFNTNTLYTHYHLEIPNERCHIKMSGNYRVTLYDENNSQEIAQCHFMVYEPLMGVSLSVTSNTDKEINGRLQQVDMTLNYGAERVTDPTSQLQIRILQNGRWHSMVNNPKPQIIMNNGLQWTHNSHLIFAAGNEYHKFETLDVNHATMGIEHMIWDGSMYQAHLWLNEPRYNYIYDEDANGAFYIRNGNDMENDRMSDYVNVHFSLKCPKVTGEIYLNGTWTNDRLDEQYRMVYDEQKGLYQGQILLKQGYYSYQYVLQQPNGIVTYLPSEGSFYQTENTYQAFVYYRKPGERTDRLVAYQEYLNR